MSFRNFPAPLAPDFPTTIGRGLLGELSAIVDPPFGLVTMADLWPRFVNRLPAAEAYWRLDVEGLERDALDAAIQGMPPVRAVVGLGGGQALDVAKYLAWRRDLPLFQFPTALSVNAAWGHRAAIRDGGVVRYVGWKVPEAVFVDLEILRTAPPLFNRSGIADVLCYHTARWDWEWAQRTGRVEARWPLAESLVDEAAAKMNAVIDALDDIRELTDPGVRALVEGLRWGGGAFANAGWNPRHIEGSEHFFFYALERLTGRHFIHGQPVGLGLLLMSAWQGNDPERMREILDRVGLPYLPETMGVTWTEVAAALRRLPQVVQDGDLWATAASVPVTEPFIEQARRWLAAGGPAPTATIERA